MDWAFHSQTEQRLKQDLVGLDIAVVAVVVVELSYKDSSQESGALLME